MNNRFLFFVLLFFLLPFIGIGQQNNTLYYIHSIPQSSLLNPAVQDDCKWFVGIPVLSSIHLNFGNTAFSYNTIVPKNSDGQRQIDPDNMIKKMHNVDFVFFEFHTNLFSLGYKYDDYYFLFNVVEKVNLDIGFPKDLFSFAWNGNTQFATNPAKFDRLGINFTHLREYSLSASKKINNELTVGTRLKLMFGKSQVTNRRSKIRFSVDEDNFYLRLTSDLLINSSIPGLTLAQNIDESSFDAGAIDPVSYLLNRKNWGLAFDFGGIYNFEDYITYQASIQDLGYIRFKSSVNSFEQTNDFEYTGPQGEEITNYFEDIGDSIVNSYLQNIGGTDPYTYFLSPKIYLGATYKVHPKIDIGVLSKTKFFQRRLIPSVTVSANTKPWKFLAFTLSYSYLNSNFNNIGMGLSLRGRHSQFYLLTDNFSSAIWPLTARGFNLRFGYNLFFGCGKEVVKKVIGCGWMKDAYYKKQKMDLRKQKKDIHSSKKKKKKRK